MAMLLLALFGAAVVIGWLLHRRRPAAFDPGRTGDAPVTLGESDDAAEDDPAAPAPASSAEARDTSQGIMPFTLGGIYTRAEIHAALGGGMQSYLPHVGGRVVCGCFNPVLNPDAPDVVLPGFGPGIERWAAVFASQVVGVPCFLKRATNVWEYVGEFRVRERDTRPEEIQRWAAVAGRTDVSMVLHLDEVH